MFQILWVATDGITTVRFSDLQSAEIYCAETGWNVADPLKVRQQVTVGKDGYLVLEDWCSRMDPQVDMEAQGVWEEDTYLPPLNSMINPNDESEDDPPVTYNKEHLHQLGAISQRLGWGFRDLMARTLSIYNQVAAYVEDCDTQKKKPNLQEIEKIVGVYAN